MSAAVSVYGHRGCSTEAPENTIAAFRKLGELAQRVVAGSGAAAAAFSIGVELDVQLSADGELVVFHDWGLQRVAGRPDTVTHLSYAELTAIDVGSWFDPQFADQRIPRLTDVFELLGDSVCYDIELKHRRHGGTALEPALAKAIAGHAPPERCMVSSFNPYALRAFRRHAPEVPLALIYSNSPDVPFLLRRGAGRYMIDVDVLKPQWELARAAMRRLRIRRRPVLPWTVNDPARAQALIARGCIGVISDDPASVAAALLTRGGDTFNAG